MTNQEISDKNYEHILNVWLAFKMNTMKDDHDLYLKGDVSLLACVFKAFKRGSIKSFILDSAHYLFADYSWGAMLRFNDVNLNPIKVNLNPISDIEKYESMIRDGISMICKGYAEANNKFLKSYNANKPTPYVIYLDANALYGHFMTHILQTEILDWVNTKVTIVQ